jgi:acetyl-CoA acyltransferase
MKEAVIVSSVRTAIGRAPRGKLRYTRPEYMGTVGCKRSSSPG